MTMNDHCRFIMAASSVAPSSLIPKAYIGRIKDPKQSGNIHKKRDFLHAVIYEDPKESFEYLDLKNLVDEDNGFIFYTNGINKGNPVDWNKCVDAVKSRPPIGNVCIVMHDNPLTFGQFAELAYSKAVLTNSTAYDTLKAKLSLRNQDQLFLRLLFHPVVVQRRTILLWRQFGVESRQQ